MADPIRRQSVSAVPVNKEGQILLQQRDDRPDLNFPGCWATFGGSVEDGETPDEAMRRELMEEIELELPLKFWKVYRKNIESAGQTFVWENFVYVGPIDRPADKITLNEGQDLGYFGREDLDTLKVAFGLEEIFYDVFDALADGTLEIEA